MSEVATKCSKKKVTFKIEKPLIGQWQCKIHDVLGNTYDCGKRDFYSSKEIDCKSYEGSDFKISEKNLRYSYLYYDLSLCYILYKIRFFIQVRDLSNRGLHVLPSQAEILFLF